MSIGRKIGETQNLVGVTRFVVYRESRWTHGSSSARPDTTAVARFPPRSRGEFSDASTDGASNARKSGKTRVAPAQRIVNHEGGGLSRRRSEFRRPARRNSPASDSVGSPERAGRMRIARALPALKLARCLLPACAAGDAGVDSRISAGNRTRCKRQRSRGSIFVAPGGSPD